MRAIKILLAVLLLFVPSRARADTDTAEGPWVGGVWAMGGVASPGFSAGLQFATRYRFVQAGVMGLVSSRDRAGLAVLGVVVPVENIEISLEGLSGYHSIDPSTSSSALFGSSACRTEGPQQSFTMVGGMVTIAKSIRTSGAKIGVSAFAATDLSPRRVQTTETCHGTYVDLFGDGGGSSSYTRTDTQWVTVGGTTIGALFRVGLGIW